MKYISFWICLIFIGTVSGQEKVENIDKIIARANDFILLKSDLEYAYQGFLASGEQPQGDAKCKILLDLVKNKIVLAKADLDSIYAEPAEVSAELERRMAYFLSQAGGKEKLEDHLGKTVDQLKTELRSQVEEQLVLQKVKGEIAALVNIRPRDVRKYFKTEIAAAPPFLPLEVVVGQIVKYGQVSKTQKETVIEQLTDIKAQILAGADFGTLAARYSQDFSNANQGGELGWYNRGELAPEFESTALTMELNEISDPIETEFGFHLIQLLDRKGKRFLTRHILIRPQSSDLDIEKSIEIMNEIRAKIIAGKTTFQAVASEESDDRLTKANSGFFKNPQNNSLYLSTDLLDPDVFFVIDTMTVGNITKPIKYRTSDGKEAVRIVYYKDKIEPHYANLEQDYEKIYSLVSAKKQQEALNDWIEVAIQEVFFNIDPDYENCEDVKKLRVVK